MTKRHAKMIQKLREVAEDASAENGAEREDDDEDNESSASDLHRDISALEEASANSTL